MSNSSLVVYTKISQNSTNPRNNTIKKITIHHVAGNCSIETIGAIFAPGARQASSNYGVGTDGRVGMYVEEKNRAWTSFNAANDHQAVTIEVANDEVGGNWHVSDKALASTIELCTDICKRNGIAKLNFTGDATGNLTQHCYFTATSCPGPYLKSKFQYIADEVNKRLGAVTTASTAGFTAYTVKVTADALNIRSGPGTNYDVTGTILDKGVYTIVDENNGWGKLKSGAGWVLLSYTVKQGTVSTTPASQIVKGSKVKIKTGAKYYTGGAIPAWVMSDTWFVSSISGDRAVLGKNVSGKNDIQSPINVNNLTLA